MSKCFSVEQLEQCKERKVIETTHVLYVVVLCGVFYVSFVREKREVMKEVEMFRLCRIQKVRQ